MPDDPGLHPVVEMHLAVNELVLEVDVDGPRGQRVGDPGQRQVVGRHQADRAAVDQAADDRLGSHGPVMGIGPVEELVEEEEERYRTRREADDLPDASDLGIESRAAVLERVLDPQRRTDDQWREPEPPARTGAPAKASTALIPTVRSSVLFPDMFEPLTISTCVGQPRARSLRMQISAGISGWPSDSAS